MNDSELAQLYTKTQTQSYARASEIDSFAIGDAHIAALRAIYEAAGGKLTLENMADNLEKRASIAEKWGTKGEEIASQFREHSAGLRPLAIRISSK